MFGGGEPCVCLINCFFQSLMYLSNDDLALRIVGNGSMVGYFPSLVEFFKLVTHKDWSSMRRKLERSPHNSECREHVVNSCL